MTLSPASSRALLDLARQAIRAALTDRLPPAPPDSTELAQRAGCFVSLHEMTTHALRGCVGQLQSDQPLAQLVPRVAESCLRDPRFGHHRVTLHELPELQIEITLLSPLRAAASPLDFDLLNEGIVLRVDEIEGCFLPQVARETGWSKEQLLDRLCSEKLGLPANAWRGPDARLSAFTTLLIGPEPFEPRLGQPHG